MEARQKKAENLTAQRVNVGDSTEDNNGEQQINTSRKTV